MRKNQIVKSISYYLRIEESKANTLFEKYGEEYIYAPSGLCVPYSESMCKRMTMTCNVVVVVRSDGSVERFRASDERKRRKKLKPVRQMQARYKEGLEIAKIENDWEEWNKTLHLFESGQGKACPKRGGKGNSFGDIGKYVNRKFQRLNDYE